MTDPVVDTLGERKQGERKQGERKLGERKQTNLGKLSVFSAVRSSRNLLQGRQHWT